MCFTTCWQERVKKRGKPFTSRSLKNIITSVRWGLHSHTQTEPAFILLSICLHLWASRHVLCCVWFYVHVWCCVVYSMFVCLCTGVIFQSFDPSWPSTVTSCVCRQDRKERTQDTKETHSTVGRCQHLCLSLCLSLYQFVFFVFICLWVSSINLWHKHSHIITAETPPTNTQQQRRRQKQHMSLHLLLVWTTMRTGFS